MGNVTVKKKTFAVSIGFKVNFGSFNPNYTLNRYFLFKIMVPSLNSA